MPLLPLIRKMSGMLITIHFPPHSLAAHRRPSTIIGSDANACIGTGEGERNDEKFDEGYEVAGRFGSTRVND